MPVRTPIINEVAAAAVQSAEGTEATPVTADVFYPVSIALDPNQQNLLREDHGLGRTSLGFVSGGNQSASWETSFYLQMAAAATPVVASSIDNLIRAAAGASVVSINTTVAATPAPTASTFAVGAGVGATLKVGDVLSVEIGAAFEMRPITVIATDTLTFSPAFTAAPASTNKVKARLFRLATAPVYLTVVNWFRDTADANTDWSRKAIDAIVGEFIVDGNQGIVTCTARGPAGQVTRTSIPTIPSLPTTADSAQSRNNGDVWIDTTKLTAYELQLTLNNGAALLPVAIGQEKADSAVFGPRSVSCNLQLDSVLANDLIMDDSEAKTTRKIFGHFGDSEGNLFGFNMPKATLSLGQYEKGAETLRIRFSDSRGFHTTSNSELFMAIG